MNSYHGHQCSSYTKQGAHCYDHQSQLPAPNESNHEAKHKCREPLNENRHLISDGIVDLVDVTKINKAVLKNVEQNRDKSFICGHGDPTYSDILVFSSPTELQSNHPISILITFLK